jgi:hypothetical protein
MIPPGERSSAFIIAHRVIDTFALFLVWNQAVFGSLIPTDD